ncbi:MAG: hypothetical protein BGO93_18925 [Mesorhizobium sp. 65-26]|jgi:transcriptional regulator with XRE-family HTH domain|uniref:helix-turn-helix domain-containing protein n=1 Tax=Mesorhizobium sp. 65-26 TaxID=1895781 RepID=UPI000964CAC7|nr:helix-turn-helix transcriptional regulator [Mesorhizobium sp. 65-26]MBN9273663.1 helix-turn-helix transcriptional regulator [Mesorhizobium sp.]OJX77659.1 MAG: hypothetical protein BGO93_18925 [Mesorhizobium sp. 65-26]
MPKYTGPLVESVDLSILQKRASKALTTYKKEKKLNLTQLSRRTGIARSHLVKIMKGESNFSIGVLYQICKVLNLSISDLIGTKADTSLTITYGWKDDDEKGNDASLH